MLARKGKEEKKGKEGPCENPYKEWIFVKKSSYQNCHIVRKIFRQ
jgi:hypothetical protein